MPPLYFEIIGWIGTIAVLAAYFLVSTEKISSTSKIYQILNLLGAAFIIVNVSYHRALPSVFLNSIWLLIALYGLVKNR